jgi:hypothetical protein
MVVTMVLYQEKGWNAKTSVRLLRSQQVDSTRRVSHTTDRTDP